MGDRNILKCPNCGASVYSNANERDCYKCEAPMIFVCKESEEVKVKKKELHNSTRKW